jgi:hypothetical protein
MMRTLPRSSLQLLRDRLTEAIAVSLIPAARIDGAGEIASADALAHVVVRGSKDQTYRIPNRPQGAPGFAPHSRTPRG